MLLAAALVGGAAALAATQAGRAGGETAPTRASLLAQIGRAQQVQAGLESTTDRLRAVVGADRSRALALSSAGTRLAQQQATLELATASVGVVGPGVTLRIADGPSASSGRVLDSELQAVVNTLWSAGAEAIAVDGQRLGPETAIRTAGDTVLVNFRPVTSPYVLAAIGDRNALQTGYAASDAAAVLAGREQLDGVTVSVTTAATLQLPATTTVETTLASPVRGLAP